MRSGLYYAGTIQARQLFALLFCTSWQMYEVSLKFFDGPLLHFSPIHPLNVLITVEDDIVQRATVVSSFCLLPNTSSSKSSHSCHGVLNRRLHNLNFHHARWLCKHSINIEALHSPFQHLRPATVREVGHKIKHGVIPIESAQVWHNMLLKSLYKWPTRWDITPVKPLPRPSTFHCIQEYTCWVLQPGATSQIRMVIYKLRSISPTRPGIDFCRHLTSYSYPMRLICFFSDKHASTVESVYAKGSHTSWSGFEILWTMSFINTRHFYSVRIILFRPALASPFLWATYTTERHGTFVTTFVRPVWALKSPCTPI